MKLNESPVIRYRSRVHYISKLTLTETHR